MAELSKTTRWSKTTVTDAGTALLTEFAAGRLLRITSAYGSISDSEENLAELTELADGREHPLTIESVVRTDETVTVCIQVTSLGNPEPYKSLSIRLNSMRRRCTTPRSPACAGTMASRHRSLRA